MGTFDTGVDGSHPDIAPTMAAPPAADVAALIVSQFGFRDAAKPPASRPALADPGRLERTNTEPRIVSYSNVGRPASWNALCQGSPALNGF